jgi:ATP-dependent helicase/nuclease subunit A
LLGEELRLLYVALTRARDRLILTASIPESKFRTSWQTIPAKPSAVLTSARSCADWLGFWFSQHCVPVPAGLTKGETAMLSWRLWNQAQLLDPVRAISTSDAAMTGLIATSSEWRQLEQRLSWGYPFGAATLEPAKTSVTRLRLDSSESTEEAVVWPGQPSARSERSGAQSKRSASEAAANVGIAHHRFLQWVSIERVGSIPELQAEAQRLVGQSLLQADDVSVLDFGGLDAFWSSPLGVRLRTEVRFIVRELPFTARFTQSELATLLGKEPDPSLEHEFVVVQGVADLVLLKPKEIWLIDFKTDHTTLEEAAEKAIPYQPQLRLYAHALARVHNRPVTRAWICFLRARAAVAMGGLATHIKHACN